MRVIDFMPPRGEAPDIVRIVEGARRARCRCAPSCVIRFDYGRVVPVGAPGRRRVGRRRRARTRCACARRSTSHGEDLHDGLRVHGRRRASGSRSCSPGSPPTSRCPAAIDPEQALADTESYWLEWAEQCRHRGDYHDEVHQSLLVLKALTYEPTGGIVAAPTTSLPERHRRRAQLGLPLLLAARRDADAAGDARTRATATRPRAWRAVAAARGGGRPGGRADHVRHRRRAAAGRARARLAARLRGLAARSGSATPRRRSSSSTCTARSSTPLYQARVARGGARRTTLVAARASCSAGSRTAGGEKDAGIWEVRGPRAPLHPLQGDGVGRVRPRRAVARGVRTSTGRSIAGGELATRSTPRCWSGPGATEKQSFTQSYDSDDLDASALLMPKVGFLDATDPRMVRRSTAIRRELDVDGLVLRYSPEDEGVDGLPGGEGVFLACSFWLAEVLALQGRARRGPGAVRAAARPAQRRRSAVRGVRPGRPPAARQLPAGVQPPGAGRRRAGDRRRPAVTRGRAGPPLA